MLSSESEPSTVAVPVTSSWGRAKRYAIVLLVLFLVTGGVFYALDRLGILSSDREPQVAAPVETVDSSENSLIAVSPETDETTIAPESLADYRSERFRIGGIAIGGEAELLVPENDPTPLAITTVRGEAFTEKGKNSSKLVISWETNKPSISEVSYGKGVGQVEGVRDEAEYGVSHSLIIPDLSQGSTYVYTIKVRDRYGGEATSEPYGVYTGTREVSLFELIAGAVGEVFGWAVDN